MASEDGRDGSVTIQQDARLYAAIFPPDFSFNTRLARTVTRGFKSRAARLISTDRNFVKATARRSATSVAQNQLRRREPKFCCLISPRRGRDLARIVGAMAAPEQL